MKVFLATLLVVAGLGTSVAPTQAASIDEQLINVGSSDEVQLANPDGTPKNDVVTIIGRVTGFVLGILGVVFLVLTLYAGILWMTASGNEDRVKKAKDLLQQSIIGLIITLSAFAISQFVVTRAESSVVGQGGGGDQPEQ